MASEIPSFDELLDLLRKRIGLADAIKPGDLHSFKELMSDHADVIADNWYWEAFEELEGQGHLGRASGKTMGAMLTDNCPLTAACT